jgi:serine/threonine-protein kinase
VNHLAGNATEARENYAQVLALARTAVHAGNAGAEIEIIYAEIGLGNQQAAAQAAQHAGSIARHFGYGDMLNEVQYALAVMHAKFGDAREAVNGLDALLRLSSSGFTVSVPLLKLDPMWDPIRHDPRFQALLKQYARSVPVSTESAGPISAATTGTGDG